jgi:hypothetical protein
MATQLWSISLGTIYIDEEGGGCWDAFVKKVFSVSFFHSAVAALNKINSKPCGKELINAIRDSGKSEDAGRVVVSKVARLSSMGASLSPYSTTVRQVDVSWAAYDHAAISKQVEKALAADRKRTGGKEKLLQQDNPLQDAAMVREMQGIPSFIALAHELVHALHYLRREVFSGGHDPDTAAFKRANDLEEARTVGLGPFAGERICENRIRHEHGFADRETYDGVSLDELAGPTPEETQYRRVR